MTTIQSRLKEHLGRAVFVDFTKSGIIGSGQKGILKAVYGDFIELENNHNKIIIVNLKEINTLKILEDEEED